MAVKLLTLDILFPGCSSLKEKRFVLSSLKTRLRRRFNVSVAEVDYHDKWQRCLLCVAMVAVDHHTVETECNRVLSFVERDHRISIADVTRETC